MQERETHEREADELDQASQATIEELEITVSAIREQLRGESRDTCIDCGLEIPPERLAAGERNGIAIQRCVHCATLEERRSSLYPGNNN
jgi:RNA polymerase-binding transcription factor DksA